MNRFLNVELKDVLYIMNTHRIKNEILVLGYALVLIFESLHFNQTLEEEKEFHTWSGLLLDGRDEFLNYVFCQFHAQFFVVLENTPQSLGLF